MRVGPSPAGRRPGLRPTASARARRLAGRVVAGADDRRLERIAGHPLGLRLLFRGLEAAFVPSRAHGLTAEVDCELRTADGTLHPWTVRITPERATARPGRGGAPQLTVSLTVADLVRMAAGELDPADAVLTGHMDLAGDFSLAMRLGELFGR